MTDQLRERFRSLDDLDFPHAEEPPRLPGGSRAPISHGPSPVRRALVAVFALALAAAGFSLALGWFRSTPDELAPIADPGGGTLAYAAYQTGGWGLNLVGADGSDDRTLPIDLPGDVFHPTWSPDGSRIAFDMDNDIYSVQVDGSEPVRLTDGPGSDTQPAWSPDGTQIAYVHSKDGNYDIWLMNADGSEPKPITSGPDLDLQPAWSPDGTHLVFQSNRSGNPEIYVMAADGTDLTRTTRSPGFDGSPAWSPDGQQIAFASDRDGPGIYVMDAFGNNVRRVAQATQVGPLDPEWSPDGSRLAYTGPPAGELRGTAIVVTDLSSGKASTIVAPGDLCCIAWRPELDAPAGEALTQLTAEGTSFILPVGWHGRADSLPGYTHRIFQASTFSLPALVDIDASEARASLSPEDILIVMNEFSALCPPCPSDSEGLPVDITGEDLRGAHEVPKWLAPLDDLPEGAALARRIFNIGPRYFDLTVEFGSEPDQAAFDRANEVLDSLSIGDWVLEPNGSCQWNELGARDPDCPEGEWLEAMVGEAGFDYRLTGGSPVAKKGQVQFFIRAEGEDRVSADRRNLIEDPSAFPIREEVDSIVVYGNDQEWTWFANGALVSLSLGPDGESLFPTIQQLRPLVEASRSVPFPPG